MSTSSALVSRLRVALANAAMVAQQFLSAIFAA